MPKSDSDKHRIEISASVECVGLLLTAECNGSGGRCTEDDASLTRGGFLERFLLGDSRARGSKTEAGEKFEDCKSKNLANFNTHHPQHCP